MREEVKKCLFPRNPLHNEVVCMMKQVMESMQSICSVISNEMIQNIIISVSGGSFEVTSLAQRLEKQIQSVFSRARVVAAVYGGKEAFGGACAIATSQSFASICTLPAPFDDYGTTSVKYMYF